MSDKLFKMILWMLGIGAFVFVMIIILTFIAYT